METQRLILLFVFCFSVFLLWDAWEKDKRPKVAPANSPTASLPAGVPSPSSPPKAHAGSTSAPIADKAAAVPGATATAAPKGEVVTITTDLFSAEIDALGGTLRRLELLKHMDAKEANKPLVLFGPEHSYGAQSGLIGEGLPNHRTLYRVLPGERSLGAGSAALEVRMLAESGNGVSVEKVYVFRRDSYLVEVALEVKNGTAQPLATHAYFQLVRDDKAPAGETAMMQTYTGAAVYTIEKNFQKIEYSAIEKGKTDYPRQASDGWIAMVQHYFVAAWLPADKLAREYYTKKQPDGLYAAGLIVATPTIEPGASARIAVPLFSGPQEQQRLRTAAPGLDLVVDFGWLTIIAWPLFWVLEKFHELSGNWGVAIILLTVSLKLLFFPLSAASYKSMAKMKLITPRLTKLREMYANDRARQNQAMMELYKTEKINPLGGCFPVVVQIPVFIALYWTLLAAIELRHAPFILWIKDLSALDPYYVLPVLMTITMILQTRMNPTPPDPVQAKVMATMPYIFSVFFFFFPAGLVLYWLVNNILSILQQWQIQRMFDRDKPAHAKR
ncbi:MAG: membrane protein insertase YidC [Betaproteobacteria bacterium]|nr:membrane protein insertase YidC [Betaproteobacteria bacterium]